MGTKYLFCPLCAFKLEIKNMNSQSVILSSTRVALIAIRQLRHSRLATYDETKMTRAALETLGDALLDYADLWLAGTVGEVRSASGSPSDGNENGPGAGADRVRKKNISSRFGR